MIDLPPLATCLLSLALVACGQTNHHPGSEETPMPEGGTGGGGSPPPSTAGMGGVGTAGSSDTAGAAGGPEPPAPPADISGRWEMFFFEDPVGVQLFQAPDGRLTGRGCAAGAPGATSEDADELLFCGDLTGRVSGQTASFAFAPDLSDLYYTNRVVIALDGSRMSGVFSNGFGDSNHAMGWLRVPDDAVRLERPALAVISSRDAAYQLRLVADESQGDEFVAERSYDLVFSRAGLHGALGAFWYSEIFDPGDGSSLRVGPVPETAPGQPTSLDLHFDEGGMVRVEAYTAAGGSYVFTATKQGQF